VKAPFTCELLGFKILLVCTCGRYAAVDISAEVRAAMMEAGWREPIVNTTSPRHLYTQLRAELKAFVRARRGGGAGGGGGAGSGDGDDAAGGAGVTLGHGDPSIAAMGGDSRGVVYMALGGARLGGDGGRG
jgi:hypothetical protein